MSPPCRLLARVGRTWSWGETERRSSVTGRDLVRAVLAGTPRAFGAPVDRVCSKPAVSSHQPDKRGCPRAPKIGVGMHCCRSDPAWARSPSRATEGKVPCCVEGGVDARRPAVSWTGSCYPDRGSRGSHYILRIRSRPHSFGFLGGVWDRVGCTGRSESGVWMVARFSSPRRVNASARNTGPSGLTYCD